MDEKKEIEQKETEEVSSTEDKYETTPIIERARMEREKMEAANKFKEELLDREEAMMTRKALGGDSDAGQTQEKKEETPKEYNERINKEISEGKHNDE